MNLRQVNNEIQSKKEVRSNIIVNFIMALIVATLIIVSVFIECWRN